MIRIGLISDTHGQHRPDALAPLTEVRDNNDSAAELLIADSSITPRNVELGGGGAD